MTGQLQHVMELYKQYVRRDPSELLPESLPEPIPLSSQRDFVRSVLHEERDLRANGADFVSLEQEGEGEASLSYRDSQGSPSEAVATGYRWSPGTELAFNSQ